MSPAARMGWMTHGVDLSAFCPECPSRMGMMLALISMTPQASAQLSTWPGSHQKNGVLTESTGYAPIYDRTLSGDYIGPLSPEWRNSPAIRDMIAVGLSGLEKNQKEQCDSSIPRSRTTFKILVFLASGRVLGVSTHEVNPSPSCPSCPLCLCVPASPRSQFS